MSTSYTSNTALPYPAHGDSGWDGALNTLIADLDGFMALAGFAVTIPVSERPTSASLNVRVGPGILWNTAGTEVDYAGTTTYALVASATNYLWINNAGVLSSSTSNWPTAAPFLPIAKVVTGASTVTSITDARRGFLLGPPLTLFGGTMIDSGAVVTVGLGTTNGTVFGATAADKLGVWGAAPIVQPSGAAQAALTDSTGGTVSTTLAAITAGAGYAQADMVCVKNAIASLNNLLEALRSAAVATGLIKGSA